MEGGLTMQYGNGAIEIQKGEVILVPAVIDHITMLPKGEFKMLESYIS
jgi:uncharacterized protein YjlB